MTIRFFSATIVGALLACGAAVAQETGTNNSTEFPLNDSSDNENSSQATSPERRDAQGRDRAALGVRLTEGPQGVWVSSVVAASPAASAGFLSGDRIRSINGSQMTVADEVTTAVGNMSPGDDLTVQVWRNGQLVELTPTLENRNDVFAAVNNRMSQGEQSFGDRHTTLRPEMDAYAATTQLRERLETLEAQITTLRDEVRALRNEFRSSPNAASTELDAEDQDDSVPPATSIDGAIELDEPQ